MNRSVVKTDLGGGKERTRVILTSDFCEATGPESLRLRQHLLGIIANQPELTACGYSPFQKLRVSHDGKAWVAEAEATVDLSSGSTGVPPSPLGGFKYQ